MRRALGLAAIVFGEGKADGVFGGGAVEVVDTPVAVPESRYAAFEAIEFGDGVFAEGNHEAYGKVARSNG
jgi:hypothetical protein